MVTTAPCRTQINWVRNATSGEGRGHHHALAETRRRQAGRQNQPKSAPQQEKRHFHADGGQVDRQGRCQQPELDPTVKSRDQPPRLSLRIDKMVGAPHQSSLSSFPFAGDEHLVPEVAHDEAADASGEGEGKKEHVSLKVDEGLVRGAAEFLGVFLHHRLVHSLPLGRLRLRPDRDGEQQQNGEEQEQPASHFVPPCTRASLRRMSGRWLRT